jgi:hypothetical protein
VATELRAEIDIAASMAEVWEVLTDFSSYPEWNPFIVEAEGRLKVGQRLRVIIRPPGQKARTFRPTVRTYEPPRGFSWLGRLVMPGVFDGAHFHEIRPEEQARCRYIQSERFSGILTPFMGRVLLPTQRGFEEMCNALKARSERGP